MKSNEVAMELIQALIKAENDFQLSNIFQCRGISKVEPIMVEFKYNNEVLLVCQQATDSLSSDRICWIQSRKENTELPQINSTKLFQSDDEIGDELAEILIKSNILSTFKNVLQKRGKDISVEKPVIVNFKLASGFALTSLQCPCDDRPCCKK